MNTQSSSNSTILSRLMFIAVGAVTGIIMSEAGVEGIWVIPGAIIGLIVFGEIYLYYTGENNIEQ